MSLLTWVREAFSDENGQADIAYGAIGVLTIGALGSLGFICLMQAWAFLRCVPLVKPDVVVNCTYDPLPMGQAAGLIFAAFATLIGSLCGYMMATRRQPRPRVSDQTVIAPAAQVVQQVSPPPPAEAVTDVGEQRR